MKEIFLVANTEQIDRNNRIIQANCAFIDLNNFITRLAVNHRISITTPIEDIDKTLFKNKYIDLIASLGKQEESMFWWASALSEKNDFASQLFERLYRLIYLERAIRVITGSNIIILCSDDVLIRQIRANYRGRFSVYYPRIFFLRQRGRGFWRKFTGGLKQINKAWEEYKKILFARQVLNNKTASVNKDSSYIVLRTWVDHRNYKNGVYNDSYFKDLPSFLLRNGKKILIFAGILSDYKNIIRQFSGDTRNLIIPTNFYLKGQDIIVCLLNTYFRRPAAKKGISFENYDITSLVYAELNKDIATTSFFLAMLQYYSCLRLAESVEIERFIYTFENYAWEKMSILGLRWHNPKIKIVGFQHAFVAKNTFKYFPGVWEKNHMPLPDKIVTLGRRTEEILRNLGNYPEGIFSVGCALRQGYLFHLSPLPLNNRGDVFVPLTITIEDTVKVLNFLYEAGMGQYPWNVYLRFHPATPVEIVIKSLKFSLPGNFIISDNPPMHKEFERCSVVLYTWTTVCLEALKMGRPVIYLDVNYPLDVDPLFECDGLKKICRKPADLIGNIRELVSIDDKKYIDGLKQAEEYLAEYFMPVNDTNMNAFIS